VTISRASFLDPLDCDLSQQFWSLRMMLAAPYAQNMVVLGVQGSEAEALELALSTGLSAYDASYIVLAGKGGLTLVAEDERLRREASRHVPTASVLQLSNQQES